MATRFAVPNELTAVGQLSLNVKSAPFNAQGDGVADDAPAIRAAVAAAPPGAVVFLPQGTYRVATPLTLRNNVTLAGAGVGATTIKAGAAGMGGVIYDGGVYTDLYIRDMTLDANNLASVGALHLYSGGHTRLRVINCRFLNSLNIWNVRIGNTGAYCVDCAMTGCVVGACSTSTYEACLLFQWQDSLVSGCAFRDRAGAGGAGLGLYGYHQRVVVSICSFLNNAVADVYVQQSDGILFIANTHSAAAGGTTAIQVINCQDVQIEACIGVGNANTGAILIYDYSGATFDGVHASIHPNSSGITVDGCRFVGYYQGLQVPGFPTSWGHNRAQSNIHVLDCTFRTVAWAPIYLSCATAQGLSDIQIEGLKTEGGAYGGCGAVEVAGNPGFAGTTTTQIIAANAVAQAVTLAATPAGLVPGQYVSVDTAGNQETIQVQSVQGGAGITAIFTKAHASGVAVVIDPSVVNFGISNLTIADSRVRPPSSGASASGVHVDVATDVRLLTNDLRGSGTSGRPTVYLTNGGAVAVARGNLGYNPQAGAIAQPAVPASGVGQVNTTGSDVMVYYRGTGVTAVTVDGANVLGAATAGAALVPAGSTLVITYTTLTWTWYGL